MAFVNEFEHGGLPYLAEVAFGYCPDGLDPRRIITGVNWSVAIGADPGDLSGAENPEALALIREAVDGTAGRPS